MDEQLKAAINNLQNELHSTTDYPEAEILARVLNILDVDLDPTTVARVQEIAAAQFLAAR